MHVLSCFVLIKSVLLTSCVFWIFSGKALCSVIKHRRKILGQLCRLTQARRDCKRRPSKIQLFIACILVISYFSVGNFGMHFSCKLHDILFSLAGEIKHRMRWSHYCFSSNKTLHLPLLLLKLDLLLCSHLEWWNRSSGDCVPYIPAKSWLLGG